LDAQEIRWWKQEPRTPLRDPWFWSLAVPSLFGAAGLAVFGVLAFAFVVWPQWHDAIPAVARWILGGAVCLAIGGEIGTVFAVWEVFRKMLRSRTDKNPQGDTVGWDWAGMVASFATTCAKLTLAYGAIFGDGAGWRDWSLSFVTAALVVLEAADVYVTLMECGFYLASYDRRYESYARSLESFLKGLYFTDQEPQPAAEPEPQPAELPEPTIDDWRAVRAGLNGDGEDLTTDDVERALTRAGFASRPPSTLRRWAHDRKGAGQ